MALAVSGGTAGADVPAALAAFGAHCFSPFLTAETARAAILPTGARLDFYDLDPFAAGNAPSPATGRPATPGTDRRCEVAVDGAHVAAGIAAVEAALAREGIDTPAEIPAAFPRQPGTDFAAARQLNPRRVAVVQVGTRQGPSGPETFLNVERLRPSGDQN